MPRRSFLGTSVAVAGLAALTLGSLPKPASAAEVTRVVSAGDADDPFDFNLTLAWLHEQRSSRLLRESPDAAGTRLVPDLESRQVRNVLAARMDFGLLPDVGLFVSAPLVLSDDRELSFDRSACGGAGAGSAGCPDETTSTILRDGILPGLGMPMYGWDAPHGRPFERPSQKVFAGPTRRGLEYLGVGLNWAVTNQARDPSKATWLLRFETRLSIGGDRKYDARSPNGNKAVGPGYHQLVWSTAFSKRFSRLEPYLGGWYMLPIKTGDSPYDAYSLGKDAFGNPQHRAGAEGGVEAILWEQPRAQQKISFELRGRWELRFQGLAQSELWEPLSGSSLCPSTPAACRSIDRDFDGDGEREPSSGITRSPSYGLFGGDAGLNVQVGPHVRFRGLFGLTYEQARFLSDGRSGDPVYDVPGRRWRIQDARSWSVFLDGALLF